MARPTLLALLRSHSYLRTLAVLAGAAGCRGTPASVVPAGNFTPISARELADLAARTALAGRELLGIRWRSESGTTSASGSGAVRIAPPDSLRIDITLRLGVGRAVLIFAGDSVWAEPEALARLVLPDRLVLWAVLGVLRLPAAASAEQLEDAGRRFVRWADEAGHLTVIELRGDTLVGGWREGAGGPLGRLRLVRGADGTVVRAAVENYQRRSRFEVEIVRRERSEAWGREVWRLRP